MCTDSKTNLHMESDGKTVFPHKPCSILLELAASDDLPGFIHQVEEKGLDINEPSLWYSRCSVSKKMCFQEWTPLAIASLYGSASVLRYILGEEASSNTLPNGRIETPPVTKPEHHRPLPLPDMNEGTYATDEFRMYSFKVKPCSRAYSHDWTECPFAHPGENARRRDPITHDYTCVPCPEFKKGTCGKGDACEFAHGVFESWLHPAQYRTRLCKDETGCSRKVCFFAHKPEELRPLYACSGSGVPSPKLISGNSSPLLLGSSPLSSPSFPRSPKVNSVNHRLRVSYPRKPSTHGFESPRAVVNSRSVGFPKRSQSFVGRAGLSSSPDLVDWGLPDGKLEWGFAGDEVRKSASFGIRSGLGEMARSNAEWPDVSWVNSMVA